MYPELYKCNSWESTFVEFCVDGINLFVENNFIDSLGPGRDSNPDPSALKPSECTTTPTTSSNVFMYLWIRLNYLIYSYKYSPELLEFMKYGPFLIFWCIFYRNLRKIGYENEAFFEACGMPNFFWLFYNSLKK